MFVYQSVKILGSVKINSVFVMANGLALLAPSLFVRQPVPMVEVVWHLLSAVVWEVGLAPLVQRLFVRHPVPTGELVWDLIHAIVLPVGLVVRVQRLFVRKNVPTVEVVLHLMNAVVWGVGLAPLVRHLSVRHHAPMVEVVWHLISAIVWEVGMAPLVQRLWYVPLLVSMVDASVEFIQAACVILTGLAHPVNINAILLVSYLSFARELILRIVAVLNALLEISASTENQCAIEIAAVFLPCCVIFCFTYHDYNNK